MLLDLEANVQFEVKDANLVWLLRSNFESILLNIEVLHAPSREMAICKLARLSSQDCEVPVWRGNTVNFYLNIEEGEYASLVYSEKKLRSDRVTKWEYLLQGYLVVCELAGELQCFKLDYEFLDSGELTFQSLYKVRDNGSLDLIQDYGRYIRFKE